MSRCSARCRRCRRRGSSSPARSIRSSCASSEQLRKGAFYSDVLDMKTTQLILFGMLLAEHNHGRRAGARRGGAQGRRELGGAAHGDASLPPATGALWAGQQRRRVAQGAARQGAGDKAMIDFSVRAALVAALVADRASGAGRGLSRAEGGRLDRQGFPLPHRRGDAGGAAALHDHRRADRRAGAGAARHRRLRRASLLTPAFAGELFGAGQPLDATKYFIILPDALGAGKSTKPSDGLRAKFPLYNYDDMVAAQHRLVTEGLGIKHLRLVIGNSMGGMQTWMWGAAYPDFMDALVPMASQPTAMSSRNWMMRRMITDAVRNDPGLEERQLHRRSRGRSAPPMRSSRIATSGGTLAYQKLAPTREKADKLLERRAGCAVQRRRQRFPLSVGFVARLRRLAGPGENPGRAAGDQRGRRRAQSAGNRADDARRSSA